MQDATAVFSFRVPKLGRAAAFPLGTLLSLSDNCVAAALQECCRTIISCARSAHTACVRRAVPEPETRRWEDARVGSISNVARVLADRSPREVFASVTPTPVAQTRVARPSPGLAVQPGGTWAQTCSLPFRVLV